MTNPTDAPTGANTPALPIAWTTRQIDAAPGAGRVMLLTAQTGRYTLDIHDATGSNGSIHIVMWSVTDRGQQLAEGVAGSPEAAKVAAEQEARRLLVEAAKCDPSHRNATLTPEERAWVVLARSLSPDLRRWFIGAAKDIAEGRKPEPYRIGA